MLLAGRVVIVSGAGRGIGKAIALACADAGAHVVLASRTQRELDAVQEEIHAAGRGACDTRICDVAQQADVQHLVAWTEGEVGPPYGLVLAAGIYGPIGHLTDVPMDAWKQAIDVNLLGPVMAMAAVLPGMKKRQEGRIVLFSGGGQNALPGFSAYVAGKGAVIRLTETVAAEVASDKVYVNAIAPGAVNTRFLDDLLQAGPQRAGAELYRKALEQKAQGGVPAGKAADLALFLLSPQSAGLYGKTLSAVWDDYHGLQDMQALSKTDLFTWRRVVGADGGTRPH